MADKKKNLWIGIDLGGTNIAAGVIDRSHDILAREKIKTKADEGVDKVIDRIVKVTRKVVDEASLSMSEICALGIGAPGTIDDEEGIVANAVNLRWNQVPLGKRLGQALKVDVVVDNDVNVGTWGEYVAGAGRGFDDMLGVFVGTGIGGGLVLGGQLYHGHCHTAGEIGHTVVNADAPLGRTTLEHCASRTNMVNTLRQLILANHPSEIVDLTDGDLDKIRSKVLAQAVEAEDSLTCTVIRQAAHYVGISIANMVTMLSLPCVVIGGGVAEALGDRYVGWVRESFDAHVFPEELRQCKLVLSTLGDDAGLIGAALLAKDKFST